MTTTSVIVSAGMDFTTVIVSAGSEFTTVIVELCPDSVTVVVWVVLLEVVLTYAPSPTIRISAITMRVTIPSETALFAFANGRHLQRCHQSYLRVYDCDPVLANRTLRVVYAKDSLAEL